MKILLVGGGTGGPVSPLLAVAAHIKKDHPRAEFLFVGSNHGPERAMAGKVGIEFSCIAAGKWRRYFSLSNFMTPFSVVRGFFQALGIIKRFQPDCVFCAGSFVQVPVAWAAWQKGVPVVMHQQDVLPGLANRLCGLAATRITVTFPDSLKDFSSSLGLFYKKGKDKVVLTGNPFRDELRHVSREDGIKRLGLRPDWPVLLVLGGGTGAAALNDLVVKALPELSSVVQIVHLTGIAKGDDRKLENYRSFEFLDDMGPAYAAADIVLARAGLSTITELSNLRKISIIVPMPDSHQELNAYMLYEHKAAIVVDQRELSAGSLVKIVRRLLFEHEFQKQLKANIAGIMPAGAAQKISDIIIKLAETHN